MSLVVSLLVGVLVVLAITVATGYFVAQEFAYMAVDRSRLRARASAGDSEAERTLGITNRTSFMLSGAQLGITVTGLLVGYVAEPLIGQSLAGMVGGDVPSGLVIAIGGVIALLFSTFIQMLFGELFPKNYAIAKADSVADALAPSTKLYLTIFGPLIWVFDKSAELLLRALGMQPVHDVEQAATVTDLRHVVEASRDTGDLSPEMSTLLDRMLDFPERTVEHAMVPRTRTDTLRADEPITEVRQKMATGHTRYPILSADEDVVGVVDLADVLGAPADSQAPVASLAREALVITQFITLPEALDMMSAKRTQIACVIDEYGGFAGIITVEDLAEEIVGEITDEHDPDEPFYEPQPDDGVWVMAGDVHIDEVERSVRADFPRGDYETVAGLVISEFGDLPAIGDAVEVELPVDPADLVHDDDPTPKRVRIEVLDIERHVPSRVRLTLEPEESAEPDAADEETAEVTE